MSYATFYSMSTLEFISSNFLYIIQKVFSNIIFGVLNLRTLLNINKLLLVSVSLRVGYGYSWQPEAPAGCQSPLVQKGGHTLGRSLFF